MKNACSCHVAIDMTKFNRQHIVCDALLAYILEFHCICKCFWVRYERRHVDPKHIAEVARNFDKCFNEDLGECYIHGVARSASASVPCRAAYQGELISNEKDVVYP